MSILNKTKKQNIKKESTQINFNQYPAQNLYVGKCTKTITDKETGKTLTYKHFDCFYGNSKTLNTCEYLINLTSTPNSIITVTKEDYYAPKSNPKIYALRVQDPNTLELFNIDKNFPTPKELDSTQVPLTLIQEKIAKINEQSKNDSLNQILTTEESLQK